MRPYLLAAAAVAGAVILRLPLQPFLGAQYTYLFFYPAVFVAAWLGGLRGALAATLASVVPAHHLSSPAGGGWFASTPAEAVAQLVFICSGVAVGAIAEQRDRYAQERSRLAERADRHRAWLDAIVADVPAVVWEAWGQPDAAAQRIDFVNRYVERMLGYTVQEWIATPNFWLTIVHPEDRERAAAEARAIFQSGVGGTSRFRWLRRDGAALWVEAQSRVILDEAGRPAGMRGVTMDISDAIARQAERNELLRRAEQAREEAERANRLKDDFLMTLSHELRTPLNAVRGWLRMLRSGKLDEARREHALDVIERNAQVQQQLVDDLLDVARIVTGKLHLELQLVQPAAVVRRAVDAVAPAAEAKGVTIEVQADPRTPGVPAAPERLQQVIWNVISNAVKFTPAGGRVRVAVAPRGDQVEITVCDSGVGIATDLLPAVFDRFRQGESGPTRSYSGLGLGLAIARSLVEAHGGTITAHSEGPGTGATFCIRIPVSPRARSS